MNLELPAKVSIRLKVRFRQVPVCSTRSKNLRRTVMVASKATQKLSSIASSWPVDPFRPNIQLKNFLKYLSAHPKLTFEAVQAAQLLRDNAIQKKYALSTKTLQPASMPRHYERLVEGYERSARGAGRPWWKVFFGVWK